MFASIEEYKEGLENFGSVIRSYSDAALMFGTLKAELEKFGLRIIPDEYRAILTKESLLGIDSAKANSNQAVAVSLSAALNGNTAMLGKTEKDMAQDKSLSSVDVTTSTDAKISMVIFKGDKLEADYKDDVLKIYGILIDLNEPENQQFVDAGNKKGRTLNIYSDTPVIVIAPKKGRIHGIANYSKILPLHQDYEDAESFEKNKDNMPKPVYIDFSGSEDSDIFIPIQEAEINDVILNTCISRAGRDYTKVLYSDQQRNNVVLDNNKGQEQLDKYRELRKRPVHFKYLNREAEGISYFYAANQTVDVLRIDITSEISTSSYLKGMFTASADYNSVQKVITVIPPKYFDDTDFDEVYGLISGIGFKDKKKDKNSDVVIFMQYNDEEELKDYIAYHVPVLVFDKISEHITKVTSIRSEWNFRVYMVDKEFRFAEEAMKL